MANSAHRVLLPGSCSWHLQMALLLQQESGADLSLPDSGNDGGRGWAFQAHSDAFGYQDSNVA